MNLLTSMGALPLLGALLIALLPGANTKIIKQAAFAVSLLVAAVGFSAAFGFERSVTEFQYVERFSWIPALGINYQLGVDGISLILILIKIMVILKMLHKDLEQIHFSLVMMMVSTNLVLTILNI